MIKEVKIGEVFVGKGLKYQCVKGYACVECVFFVNPEGEGVTCARGFSVTGLCSQLFRSDDEFVILKLV